MVTGTDMRRWLFAFTATLCAVLVPIGFAGTTITAREALGQDAALYDTQMLQDIEQAIENSGLWSVVVYIFPYIVAVVGFFALVGHIIVKLLQ